MGGSELCALCSLRKSLQKKAYEEAKLLQCSVFLLSSIAVPAAEYAHTYACHDNDILDVEGHIHSV